MDMSNQCRWLWPLCKLYNNWDLYWMPCNKNWQFTWTMSARHRQVYGISLLRRQKINVYYAWLDNGFTLHLTRINLRQLPCTPLSRLIWKRYVSANTTWTQIMTVYIFHNCTTLNHKNEYDMMISCIITKSFLISWSGHHQRSIKTKCES